MVGCGSPFSGVARVTTSRCPLLPIGEYVCLEPDPALTQVGALVLAVPDAQYRGRVRAVSPEAHDVAVGDHVLYQKFTGTTVEVNGRAWLLVRERDCLAALG